MKLQDSDESQLILWFADAVRDSAVTNWGLYNEDLQAPQVQEDTQKRLDKYLDGGGLVQFFDEFLFRKILKGGIKIGEDDLINTTSLPGYGDSLAIAKELLSELKSAPRKYSMYARAPNAFSDATRRLKINIKLSDQLSLISSSFLSDISFDSGMSCLDEWIWRNNHINQRSFADGHLYFKFEASGYITDKYRSKLIMSFFHEVRAFYGACLAHNILYPYSDTRDTVIPLVMAVDDAGRYITNVYTLDTDLVQATYFVPGYNMGIRYNKTETFEKAIGNVVSFFKCSSPKLKTSSIWLLRAKLSDRSMDTVLESAIALEVLLGDQAMSDKIGLTRLMANRCAYALGKSIADRDDHMKFFEKFYKLRSEIVHNGKLSHSSDEEDTVGRGLKLASDMLVYEQRLDCGG